MARLAECTQDKSSGHGKRLRQRPAPRSSQQSASSQAPIRWQAWPPISPAIQPSPQPNQPAASPPVDPLQALAERWQQLPAKISLTDLEKDPELAQTQIQLIYDTEIITQEVCGAPSGDDALLLRIAQAPNQVEQE